MNFLLVKTAVLVLYLRGFGLLRRTIRCRWLRLQASPGHRLHPRPPVRPSASPKPRDALSHCRDPQVTPVRSFSSIHPPLVCFQKSSVLLHRKQQGTQTGLVNSNWTPKPLSHLASQVRRSTGAAGGLPFGRSMCQWMRCRLNPSRVKRSSFPLRVGDWTPIFSSRYWAQLTKNHLHQSSGSSKDFRWGLGYYPTLASPLPRSPTAPF